MPNSVQAQGTQEDTALTLRRMPWPWEKEGSFGCLCQGPWEHWPAWAVEARDGSLYVLSLELVQKPRGPGLEDRPEERAALFS